MAQHFHINNAGTNLTSNQIAGVTTTPINAVPSISVPFYAVLDATNVNGHYEEVEVTSKTATNINHAATSFAHTTAEEVRFPFVATEADEFSSKLNGAAPINAFAPQGFLQNGKIVVTDAAGITVAIKTLAGTDPSATDPVYVRIGDTVRTISAALSVAKADGTNWCNAGSAELATKEIDYFVYLGYNATDGVVIGFSRYPGANSYDDFSATTTNEKYCAISTITTATATDYYEVIGRFAATLSAGAGYTWSVPTYTAKNLIQRPIYETRLLTWTPTWTGFSVNPTGTYQYRVFPGRVMLTHSSGAGGTSNATTFKFTAPFTAALGAASAQVINVQDAAGNQTTPGHMEVLSTNSIDCYKTFYRGTWTGSSTKDVFWHEFTYEI